MKPRTTPTLTSIAQTLERTIGESSVDRIARKCGLIRRKRDITPLALLVACMSTLAGGKAKWLADILRTFNHFTSKTVRYKPFHKQLAKPQFAEFARLMLNEVLQKLLQPVLKSIPGGKLSMFRDILMHDGCSFAVKDSLAKTYPGRFTKISPAAIELHVTMSGLENNLAVVTLAPDKESERQFSPNPEDVEGCLLLEDRGYESQKVFIAIDDAGGHFIVRGNTTIKPMIIKARGAAGHRLRNLEGKPLRLEKLARENVDLEIEWKVRSSVYRGRLVLFYRRGKRNRKHFTLLHTNLTSEQFSQNEIGELYRLRWQIELLFKEWKSHTSLQKFDTSKPPIVEGLIWMSLLTATLLRHITGVASRHLGLELSTSTVANTSRLFLDDILKSILSSSKSLSGILKQVFVFFRTNAQRAHPKRDRKKGRFASGLCPEGCA